MSVIAIFRRSTVSFDRQLDDGFAAQGWTCDSGRTVIRAKSHDGKDSDERGYE